MTILYNIYISDITMKFCIFYIQHWKFFRNIWTISYNHDFSIIEKECLHNLSTIYHSHYSGILIGFSSIHYPSWSKKKKKYCITVSFSTLWWWSICRGINIDITVAISIPIYRYICACSSNKYCTCWSSPCYLEIFLLLGLGGLICLSPCGIWWTVPDILSSSLMASWIAASKWLFSFPLFLFLFRARL